MTTKRWIPSSYEKEDLPAIGRFFERVYTGYGTHGSAAYFQWKIVDNPVRPGIINIVRTPDGIGSLTSLTPKSLFMKGEKLLAAEIGDTFTDPAYQRQGMFALLINQTRMDGNRIGIDFIYGTPNNQSMPGYEKYADFRQMPAIDVQSLYFPVHVQRALRTRLPRLLSSVAGFAWSRLVRAWLWVRGLHGARHGWHIEEVAALPEDWDSFWEEVRSSSDFMLSREREYLRWRYFDGPYRYHVLIARRAGKIRGYLIHRGVTDDRMPSLRIADYLSAPGEEHVLAGLLDHAIRTALQTGAVMVSAWCPSSNPLFRRFKSYGFLGGGEIPVICHQNEIARKIEAECRTWHFSIGDSDNV